jgi:hypothetical protein
MADAGTWQQPLVRSAFPVPLTNRLLRLWDEREVLLRALDSVPHTFCHLDAWRANMFSGEGSHGLILIDWAFPGRAALGTDAGDLFGGSFSLPELGNTEPHLLDQAIFDGYLEGLCDAGWHGNVREVRFAFAAFCALKYGCFLFWLRQAPNESLHGMWERVFKRPFAEYLHLQARLLYYLLELGDEAHSLIRS